MSEWPLPCSFVRVSPQFRSSRVPMVFVSAWAIGYSAFVMPGGFLKLVSSGFCPGRLARPSSAARLTCYCECLDVSRAIVLLRARGHDVLRLRARKNEARAPFGERQRIVGVRTATCGWASGTPSISFSHWRSVAVAQCLPGQEKPDTGRAQGVPHARNLEFPTFQSVTGGHSGRAMFSRVCESGTSFSPDCSKALAVPISNVLPGAPLRSWR